MVDIRTIPDGDLDAFRRLHNAYFDCDKPLTEVEQWHEEHPELLLGAYEDDELVGHCLGRPHSESEVRIPGIAVRESHQRRGIGSALLSVLEDRAVELGFECITLGSAGGYVDEFYVANGYTPGRILVTLSSREIPVDPADSTFQISERREEQDAVKLYIEAGELDRDFMNDVQETFGDPDAIYIMSKELSRR